MTPSPLPEQLTRRGAELLTASATTDSDGKPTNQHLAVIARLSIEDGQLMLQAAERIRSLEARWNRAIATYGTVDDE